MQSLERAAVSSSNARCCTPAKGVIDPDWVLAQTLARRKRELETADQEYAARLAAARRKDAALRMRARKLCEGRKRPVRSIRSLTYYVVS